MKVIFRVKVSCIMSVDGIILWLVNYVAMLLVVCQLSRDVIGCEYNTINLRDTTHFDSEDDYHTGCRTSVTVNNNSPIRNYVHQDDQTQPTFEMTPGFKLFTISNQLTAVFRPCWLDKLAGIAFLCCAVIHSIGLIIFHVFSMVGCCYCTRVFCRTNPKKSHIDGYKNIFNNTEGINFIKEGNNFEGVNWWPPND